MLYDIFKIYCRPVFLMKKIASQNYDFVSKFGMFLILFFILKYLNYVLKVTF